MKMRVRGNSIRLRLTRSEIAEFDRAGRIEEIIEFGDENKLIYALESEADAKTGRAAFEGNRVVVTVPRTDAKQWINSNEVSIKAEQNIGGDMTLRLLIEKDFACLEPREGKEDADTFPHPSGDKKC